MSTEILPEAFRARSEMELAVVDFCCFLYCIKHTKLSFMDSILFTLTDFLEA